MICKICGSGPPRPERDDSEGICKNCLEVWQRYDRWPGERRVPPDELISVGQAEAEGILDWDKIAQDLVAKYRT